MRTRLFVLVLAVVTFATDGRALAPDEVLIVISSSGPAGTRIAKEYCAKRHVPESHIAAFPMPTSETISRNAYDSYIADPLREFIEDNPGLKSRIRFLLTVYGVPIRIGRYTPTSEEKRTIVSLSNRVEERDRVLREQIRGLSELAIDVGVSVPSAVEKLGSSPASINALPNEIRLARSFLDTVSKRIDRLDYGQRQENARRRFDEIRTYLLGGTGERDSVGADGEPAVGETSEVTLDDRVKEHIGTQIGTKDRDKLYAAREDTGGLIAVCDQMLADVAQIEKRDSEASVDSELSLLYWRDYNLRRWLPNLLNPAFGAQLKPPFPPRPLMVARLDGPTPELASELIDRAIRGEDQGLRGTFYIDASSAKRNQGKMYRVFDESLEKLAEGVRTNTSLEVVLDEGGELFASASCPDAALYCGWYSLNKYIDAFTWVPGAVGYHISSFTAQGLHNKDSEGWCKRMLEEGVAATLGPVSEPYLHAFPLPENFFKLLLTGKLSLVECYYLTKPFSSWRMILVGDPLYTPFRYHPVMSETASQDEPSARSADN